MIDKLFLERNGYTYRNVLGEGMYGKVVCAYSTHQKQRVAIKIVDTKKLHSDSWEIFLSREMEIVKSLNHPNIVKTYRILDMKKSRTVYMVMELCVKGNLSTYVTSEGSLSEHSSCRLFTQLCEAIQYLHNRDLVHRDLKCDNLLLDMYLNLKVGDFGFSKRLIYMDSHMKLSETYCGSLSYTAPEVLIHSPYNPKVSDVWSMGVVLYRMLYGSMPFNSTNLLKMVEAQKQHRITFPNSPTVSSEAQQLIQSILHPTVEWRITIGNILQSSWMLKRGRMEDSHEASTSSTGSRQEEPQNKNTREDMEVQNDNSDPEEGPSTAAERR
ncbi:testis-specific serine/threonine-protein kinase 1-like [Scomber japonicus]|uniref:testis-specific serine/threonine-protein kinase 1-like n=1 Tax=Scomber japonicus TaxID=13676 RepID=UPI0023065860|nr:testis-specific serine/threonine-protein kinase 1-like [Scomber japonicus]